jgi:arylformamidase
MMITLATTSDWLEAEYNNRARVPDHAAIFARWSRESVDTRAQHASQMQTLAYGDHSRQSLDLFMAPHGRAWLVFIHGGYWRSLSKDEFSWLAPAWMQQGVNVAVVNYRLCPEVSIEAIVDDVNRAVAALARHPHFAAAQRCALVGHSAGGHLVAMLASMGRTAMGLPPDLALMAMPISGVFDMSALLSVSMNDDLRLTRASAAQLSPIHRPAPAGVRIEAFVGGDESNEFLRQTALLGKAWPNAVPFDVRITARHHFDVLDDLIAGDGIMASRLKEFFRP